MAYLALYRKYRPKGFDQVIGQEHITRTLANQIMKDRIGHAYLFCGARGTGKTSCAKIFAKAVNCEHPQDGSPCNQCPTCLALSDPANIDIVEIDAASNNRVDEIRDLREKVQYPPVHGRYKVYIIDEVHMLTDAAFNALLKTLEEPPRHVIFVLATTEVQKLPATILSRCMRFDFKLIPAERIAKLIGEIYDDIKKPYQPEAVMQIAKAGEGSCRDALSLADLCVSASEGVLTYQDVLEVIGASDRDKIAELADCVLSSDPGGALRLLDDLISRGKSVNVLNRDLLSYFRDLTVCRLTPDPNDLLHLPAEVFKSYASAAEKVSKDKLIRCVELLAETENELKFALHPRVLLEAALLRCARPEEDFDPKALLARLAEAERKLAGLSQIPVRGDPTVPSAPKAVPLQPVADSPTPRAPGRVTDPESGKSFIRSAPSPKPVGERAAAPVKEAEKPFDPLFDGRERSSTAAAGKVWGGIIRKLRTQKPMLYPLCRDLEAVSEGKTLVVLAETAQQEQILNIKANHEALSALAKEEGYSFEVRQKSVPQKSVQDTGELQELVGDKLIIR